MAVISMWERGQCIVRVDVDSICVNIGDQYVRLYEGEAVKLRDDLSAAILEAATAAAKAKAEVVA